MINQSIKSLQKKWTINDIPNQENKYAFITGANSGIGYFTAKALAEKGCHVILSCRSLEKCIKTKEKLIKIIPHAKLSYCHLDLSDLKNVSKKSEEILDQYKFINLLINNAGIMHPPKTLSAQGYEIQFAVNHLSHMLLTIKLLPLIEKKSESRIVTVTSGAQFFGKVGWNNIKADKYYNKWESYANSKLANIMFALELNLKLNSKNIASMAAHPGIAKTNLFLAQKPSPSKIERLSLGLFSPFFQSAEMGALPQLYAATSKNAKTGDHYGPKYNFRGPPKLSPTAPIAKDEKERGILWDKSYEIIKDFI